MTQSAVLESLVRARYAGLDFDTHLDDLKARLQIKFAADFNDFAVSGLGIMLMDVISYGLDTLSFYLDRRATDTYISTARTRRSVARLARQLGYKMGAAIASSTDLTVYVKNPQVFAVTIPKGFQFKGPKSLIFEAADAVTFPAGSSDTKLVSVYQGRTVTETFSSDGTPNQVFELTRAPSGSSIAGGTVKVVVDGVPYEEKEFLDFEETEQFELGYNDDPPTLRFGNGSVGKIPPTGASIAVEYVITDGKAGQVNKNTITEAVSPLIVSFTIIQLGITNQVASVGGDDLEDLDHAKTYAPKVWKTRKVAITREDYESLAGSYADPLFGRVAVAQALSPRSAENDLELLNDIIAIRGLVGAPVTTVQADIATIETTLTGVVSELDSIDTSLNTTVGLVLAAHSSDCGTAVSTFRSIKNEVQEAEADNTDIDGAATDAKSLVDSLTVAGSSQLTATDKSNLQGWLATILAESSSITSHTSFIASQAGSGVTVIGQLRGRLEDVGLDLTTSGTQLYLMEESRAAMASAIGVATPTRTGLFILTKEISDLVVDNSADVEEYLQAIYDHVDRILSSDCMANLVTVPILVKDVDGFYVSPSTGLIKSLQAYLEQRNEVTQTVEVVSGELYLVPAVVTVAIAVYPGYIQSVAETAVRTTVEGLLKGRSFGQSLYLSIVIQTVLKVAGVGWCNVTIDGYYAVPITVLPVVLMDKVDSEGNLILTMGEVLTKGAVTVTSRQLTYVESGNLIPKIS